VGLRHICGGPGPGAEAGPRRHPQTRLWVAPWAAGSSLWRLSLTSLWSGRPLLRATAGTADVIVRCAQEPGRPAAQGTAVARGAARAPDGTDATNGMDSGDLPQERPPANRARSTHHRIAGSPPLAHAGLRPAFGLFVACVLFGRPVDSASAHTCRPGSPPQGEGRPDHLKTGLRGRTARASLHATRGQRLFSLVKAMISAMRPVARPTVVSAQP
jgi:hypothetical protein